MSDDGMVTFETSEEITGGQGGFVDAEGTFHFNGVSFHINEKPDGKSYKGWTLLARVVGGTDETQVGKQMTIYMGDKKPNGSETFWKDLRTRVLVACGFMKIEAMGKPVSFNPKEPGVFQFVAKVKANQDGDRTFYGMSYMDIYHVDDPEVAEVPKDAESLSFIDQSRRYTDPKVFERLNKKSEKKAESKSEVPTPADLDI